MGCSSETSSSPTAGSRPDAAFADGHVPADAGSDGTPSDARPPDSQDAHAADTCPAQLALTLQQISAQELRETILEGTPHHTVDVREPEETAQGVIDGALRYPWTSGVLKAEHASLPTGAPLHVICRSGGRSLPAATFLLEQGHTCVFNVQGGMTAWQAEGYPTVPPK
jgi:rhodanese-related sulfurtransferase